MSLSNELENLIYWSNRASSVTFKKPLNHSVQHDLKEVKRRRLLRDAQPDEYSLRALCASDQTIARRFEQELNSGNTVTTNASDIERRLYLIKEMSEMSGDTALCKQIDQSMEKYVMVQSRLQELNEQFEKNQQTIASIQETPQPIDWDPFPAEPKQTELDEIEQRRRHVEQLEEELTRRRHRLAELRKSKAEHQSIHQKLRVLQQEHERLTERDHQLALLKREIKEKKKVLASVRPATEVDSLDRLQQQVLHSLEATDPTVDASDLLKMLVHLHPPSTTTATATTAINTNFQTRHLYRSLLAYVVENNKKAIVDLDQFSRLFPHQTQPHLKRPQEQQVKARILLKLMDEGDIPLTDLTRFIEGYATDHGFDPKEASQSIHKLVGHQLLTIEHTEIDSIVHLLL